MAAKQPQHFLIETLVSTVPGSKPRVVSYWNPTVDISGQPLKAGVGDRIAWIVLLAQLNGYKMIPYTVSFVGKGEPDDSFFGVSALTVLSGGLSEFLTVRSLSGKVSYRIEAPGYGCLLDPDIQSGDSALTHVANATAAYMVSWDTGATVMTCTKNGAPSAFPITASVGDTVGFAITAGSGFEIDFAISNPLNLW